LGRVCELYGLPKQFCDTQRVVLVCHRLGRLSNTDDARKQKFDAVAEAAISRSLADLVERVNGRSVRASRHGCLRPIAHEKRMRSKHSPTRSRMRGQHGDGDQGRS
jgi:hypothetical protein